MSYFTTKRINEYTTEIIDVTEVRSFLIEGSERAVLVDTGTGVGNIKEIIDNLTHLPYSVILTHGHVDHAGGAGNFSEVYLPQKDEELQKTHCTRDRKINYLQFIAPDVLEKIDKEKITEADKTKFLPYTDGSTFELGDITLEMIEVPGHTPGIMCVLLKEKRVMILGDACNNSVFLFDEEATSVDKYRKSLKKLIKYDDAYDIAWFSHGEIDQSKSVVAECINITEEILQRTDDKVSFEFLGKSAFIAKETDASGLKRLDGKAGNIIYSITKLF